MFRNFIVWLTIFLCFIFYVFICIPFFWMIPFIHTKDRLLDVSRYLVRLIFKSMRITLRVEGLDRLPKEAFILMSNHQSMLDIVVLMAAIPKRLRFLAKKELRRIPFLGLSMQANGQFFIDRDNPRVAIKDLKAVEEYVKQGGDLCIFPEGTRSLDGTLLPLKKGSFRLPAKLKCPIVPCVIKGSGALLEKGKLLPQKGGIVIALAESIDPKTIASEPSQKCDAVLLKRVEEAMKAFF